MITAAGANAVNAESDLTFDGSTLAVTGAVTISGNLSVSGTTTSVNSTEVSIGDRILELNSAAASGDGGIYVRDHGTAQTGSLLWDTTNDYWKAGLKGNEVKLVTLDSTDTLTNKTLTAPVITSIVPTGGQSLTLPTSTDTIVGRATTDTLTNKTLTAPVISTIVNNANTLTLPTTADTIVGRATADTLTNKTLHNPVITGTLHVTSSILFEGSTANDHKTTLTVTDPTGTRVILFPDLSGTVSLKEATETLLNKTLTSPTITSIIPDAGQTLTLPTTTGTLARTSDNVASATVLETARNIGGVSFNGSANIDLPGVNTSGTQDTSGNAATATTATTSVTSSLTQNIEFTRFGGTVTDDYHVMLGGDAGATGGSGLRIPTQLKATSVGSQNHLKYNVNTGKLSGVQNLEGTASIATKLHYIAHSKTSSFLAGTFYDVPLIKQQAPLNEYDDSNTLVGHTAIARPTLGIKENRIRYNPVTMHLSGSVSSSVSFANIIAVGSSSFNDLTVTGNISAGGTVDGRDLQTDGTKLDSIETNADVTDGTNVEAAGALMDSEVTDLAGIKGVTISTLATLDGSETLTNKTLTSPDINGGTIDESNITVGSGKTLDVSGGTLTLVDNQISGDKVEGGTIASTTITSLASTNIVTTHLTASNDISSSITSTGSFGFLNVPGDAIIGGTVRAQEFHTEFVSASIIYESGSSQFGDTLDDTHDFIGTMAITGSLTGSFNTSASFGYVRTHGNMEALGTGSFRVLEVVETVRSQGSITAPGFIATGDSSFNDDVTLGGDRTHSVNLRSHITGSNGVNISGSFTSTGSFGKLEIAKTGSFGRVQSTNMTGTILTAAQPNITSVGTLSSVDINGGNIDGTTIATSDITVGADKTLDVSGGTLTTSAAQNLAIIQGGGSNVDIGSYSLTAQTLVSDVATGTAPLTITSTTAVSNLNADLLDGNHGSHYTDFSNMTVTAGEVTNTMLENDSVSYGGVEVDLGSSDATPAFNLQDATAYPGDSSLVTTGTITTGVWNSTFGTAASASISGAFSADSASFSTRITTEEANVDALQVDSASFSTRTNALETTMVSEQTNIDNLQSDSGSFSTRTNALETTMVSEQTNIDNLQSDSGSFSTRITQASASIVHATASIAALASANTGDVTFGGSYDYLSLSNQVITLGQVDLSTDVTGTLPLSNTGLVAGTNITLDTNTLNVDDAFLVNNADDTTSGVITAGGFNTSGNVTASLGISGSVTSTGSFARIEVTENIIPKVHNVSELGSPTNRWANIYSADLQLSNEDNEVGNEIDGTKGSWTVQEGEDDLYLLNRKNGKKYRFKLEEIT